ncbi:MAG: molybdopterin-dependent oxidoreductase [Candidatus Tectomicrobia bacterium]|nr:molybdopterin-dependent oxidoreductase [Candidatus Tectomicrobia bacterium]
MIRENAGGPISECPEGDDDPSLQEHPGQGEVRGGHGPAGGAVRTGKAVCPYCGVGCLITAAVFENRITKISAGKSTAPNFGMLCSKGVYLKDVFDEKHRLSFPMIRRHRGMAPTRVSWEEAISFTAESLQRIREKNGNAAAAFYGSGQLDTEASYLFTKLFKGCLGTNNMDTNSRLCMSSAVAAYVRSFGSDGPAACYADISDARVILVIGANMAENHPVLFQMIRRARVKSPGMRVVVIDPRRTKTAEFADVHVPLAPGSDVAFLQVVAKRLLALGRVDKRFVRRSTEGFDGYRASLESLDEEALLSVCNIHPARAAEVVEYLAEPCRLLTFYCQGTNQSTQGVDKCLAIHNLHLQLGEIGKKGSGVFSLTGQPNAMGGREVGYLSHQLPGYRFVANESHRAYLEGARGISPGGIASRAGLSAIRLFQAAAQGKIKALWVAATNPAVTLPDVKVAREGLRKAEFVIVQDCYFPTETAAMGRKGADHDEQRAPGGAQREISRTARKRAAGLVDRRRGRPGDGFRGVWLRLGRSGLGRVPAADSGHPVRHGGDAQRPPEERAVAVALPPSPAPRYRAPLHGWEVPYPVGEGAVPHRRPPAPG